MTMCSLVVFAVQPLSFRAIACNAAPTAVLRMQRYAQDAQSLGDAPEWAVELDEFYPNRHFRYRRLEEAMPIESGGYAFRLSAWLCSNATLNQHLVLFELHADAVDSRIIDMEGIRSLLVSADHDGRPESVRAVIRRACEQAARIEQAGIDELEVRNDTCNVTLFLRPECAEYAQSPTMTAWMDGDPGHGGAERLTVGWKRIDVSDKTLILFGSRIHVVFSSSDRDVSVIKLILFMLQDMWFYVQLYLRYAASLHQRTLVAGSSGELDDLEETAGRLVYLYQAVRLQNESAKIAYESFSDLFYGKVEGVWGIERSVDQLERYAVFFREFIKDVREVQVQKTTDVMNYILFGLSLFGFVGLWANILTSEVAVHDLVSFGHLLKTATTTGLGFATLVVLAVSVVGAIWFVRFSERVRHGRRVRHRGEAKARLHSAA